MQAPILQNKALQKATQYFNTYEQREQAFRNSVSCLIPRKYLGQKLFWKDFDQISFEKDSLYEKKRVAYITSNPKDCLTFGTPWQVLKAALMCSGKQDKDFSLSINQIVEEFGLHENLYQSVRTLSGGETVKLSLAKSFAAANCSSSLSIASPFTWLSRDNKYYFHKLFEYFQHLNIPVQIFALKGEDSDQPVKKINILNPEPFNNIDFSIYLKNVHITFGVFNNSIYSNQTKVTFDDISIDLTSPCLLAGDNGQGKSLLGKIIANAINYHGSAGIKCHENTGRARLLFQDVISQTMLRTFDSLAASNGPDAEIAPLELYKKIIQSFISFYEKMDWQVTETGMLNQNRVPGRPHTLLEIKIILVALRLCTKPCALILDEPDWGLNKSSGIAFVHSVIKVSHVLKVPVILISHKSWWTKIVKTSIQAKRTNVSVDKKGKRSFQILIQREL